MHRLETVGVVRQISVGRRNRAYEARAIIDAFTALERQLASPAGNTRSTPPRRRALARPQITPEVGRTFPGARARHTGSTGTAHTEPRPSR